MVVWSQRYGRPYYCYAKGLEGESWKVGFQKGLVTYYRSSMFFSRFYPLVSHYFMHSNKKKGYWLCESLRMTDWHVYIHRFDTWTSWPFGKGGKLSIPPSPWLSNIVLHKNIFVQNTIHANPFMICFKSHSSQSTVPKMDECLLLEWLLAMLSMCLNYCLCPLFWKC